MPTYSAIRDQNQETLRRAVVAAADQLLRAHGAEAVTVRRIAQQLDCSTTVIYNLFGSKDGLANMLYREGCHLLHATLAAVPPHPDPARYLQDLAWGYRAFADQYPHYYRLMFSGSLPQFTPDPTSMQDVATAMALLLEVLERYTALGVLRCQDAPQTAMMLWGALHGVIQLGFAGHLGDAATSRAIYAHTVATLVTALLLV